MTSLYVCLVIASVLGGSFEEEFKSVLENYDIKNWCTTNELSLSFKQLSSEWIQIGSKTIKMIAAAAKFCHHLENVLVVKWWIYFCFKKIFILFNPIV